MHDLPKGPELLALAHTVLLDKLLPLLPADRRIDARLVASCMAIAAREAAFHGAPTAARALALLYRPQSPATESDAGAAPSAKGGERTDPAGDASPTSGGATTGLWRRFAGDLRRGAFEQSATRERQACAILWQLTLAKLYLANPRFLNANGIAWPVVSGE